MTNNYPDGMTENDLVSVGERPSPVLPQLIRIYPLGEVPFETAKNEIVVKLTEIGMDELPIGVHYTTYTALADFIDEEFHGDFYGSVNILTTEEVGEDYDRYSRQ